jgi:membrane protein implicated in regulation of membrane protease activity
MVVAWLLVGALLVFFELHHLAFYALFGAVGAFAAAAVAVAAPEAIALQGGVAVAVAVVGVVVARPWASRTFHHSS